MDQECAHVLGILLPSAGPLLMTPPAMPADGRPTFVLLAGSPPQVACSGIPLFSRRQPLRLERLQQLDNRHDRAIAGGFYSGDTRVLHDGRSGLRPPVGIPRRFGGQPVGRREIISESSFHSRRVHCCRTARLSPLFCEDVTALTTRREDLSRLAGPATNSSREPCARTSAQALGLEVGVAIARSPSPTC